MNTYLISFTYVKDGGNPSHPEIALVYANTAEEANDILLKALLEEENEGVKPEDKITDLDELLYWDECDNDTGYIIANPREIGNTIISLPNLKTPSGNKP